MHVCFIRPPTKHQLVDSTSQSLIVCANTKTPLICITTPLIHATGWRRRIGSPKLQIIFHKRATKYRSLLQEMTYKDKGSYESSPPCKTPLIHTKTPLIHIKMPFIHTKTPPIRINMPLVHIKTPSIHTKTPLMHS